MNVTLWLKTEGSTLEATVVAVPAGAMTSDNCEALVLVLKLGVAPKVAVTRCVAAERPDTVKLALPAAFKVAVPNVPAIVSLNVTVNPARLPDPGALTDTDVVKVTGCPKTGAAGAAVTTAVVVEALPTVWAMVLETPAAKCVSPP